MESVKDKQQITKEILSEITAEAGKKYGEDIHMYVTDYIEEEDVMEDIRNLSYILNDRIKLIKEPEQFDEYSELSYSNTVTRISGLLSRLVASQKNKSDYIFDQIEKRAN